MSLKQGFFKLFYFTWLHNADAIALVVGILLILALMMLKPKRKHAFFLIGFISLLVRFQYLKHILDPLLDQTVSTVIEAQGRYGARRLFDIFFQILVPLALWIVGWGGIFVGILVSDEDKKW